MRGHPDPPVPLGSIASKAGATGPLTIAGLGRARVRDAVDVLCDSHADYPAFSHLFPDRDSRRRILRALFTATVQDARSFGAVLTASVAGRMLGAGVWLPPGRFPWSAWRKLRGTRGLLPVLRWAPDRIAEFAALGRNIEHAFPDTPHWYLEVLGVRAGAQGRGIGQALMRPAMARADRDRLPCHLETSDPANIAFYERFGFVFAEQRQLIPDGPPHYMMRRRPGPEASSDPKLSALRGVSARGVGLYLGQQPAQVASESVAHRHGQPAPPRAGPRAGRGSGTPSS